MVKINSVFLLFITATVLFACRPAPLPSLEGDGNFEVRLGLDRQAAFYDARHLIGTPDAVFVGNRIFLNLSSVKSAKIIKDSPQQTIVELTLTKDAQTLLAELTSRNKGKRLCIIMNNSLVSAPVIKDKIDSTVLQITGHGVPEEFAELVYKVSQQNKTKK